MSSCALCDRDLTDLDTAMPNLLYGAEFWIRTNRAGEHDGELRLVCALCHPRIHIDSNGVITIDQTLTDTERDDIIRRWSEQHADRAHRAMGLPILPTTDQELSEA